MADDLKTLFKTARPVMNAPWEAMADAGFAVAVSNAGGLGLYPCGLKTPETILSDAARIASLTDRPFGLALTVRKDVNGIGAEGETFIEALSPLRRSLGLPEPDPAFVSFDEQFEAALKTRASVIVFVNGGPREVYAERLEARGLAFGGFAASPRDAKALLASGASFLVAQGLESGGPLYAFETPYPKAPTALAPLLETLVRIARGVPVLACGSIVSKKSVDALKALGAAGFVLGSALSASHESALTDKAKASLAYTDETSSTVTCAPFGLPARLLENGLIQALGEAGVTIPAYPEGELLVSDIIDCARRAGRLDLDAIPLEPQAYLAKREPVETILDELFGEPA